MIVCAETDRHEDLVLAAAAAGKHLFVEKPLGLGAGDAARMADAIERAGVLFQTGYFMRGQPINRFLREQIGRGSFGTLTRLRVTNCHAGALNGLFDTEWRWMAIRPSPASAASATSAPTRSTCCSGSSAIHRSSGHSAGRQRHPALRRLRRVWRGDARLRHGATGSIAAGWVDVSSHVTLEIGGTTGRAVVVNGELYFESTPSPARTASAPGAACPSCCPTPSSNSSTPLAGRPDVPLVTAREAATRSAVMEALYTGARQDAWVPVS